MCGFFWIGLIDFMLAGKKDFTDFFPSYDFKKNDDIILTYFKDGWNWQKKLARTDKNSTK